MMTTAVTDSETKTQKAFPNRRMPHQKDGSLITLLSLRTILDFFSHQKMYHYFLKQLPVGNSATSATSYLMQLQRLFSAIFFLIFVSQRLYCLCLHFR